MSPHGDYDHAGYGIDLVNNFNVKNRFTNKANIIHLKRNLMLKVLIIVILR